MLQNARQLYPDLTMTGKQFRVLNRSNDQELSSSP